jgi:hypothetical protein
MQNQTRANRSQLALGNRLSQDEMNLAASILVEALSQDICRFLWEICHDGLP